jgi:exodeoxyribonuclease V gamma subunit
LTPAGQIFYRAAKVKARDLLSAWCHHLLWCSVSHPDTSKATFFIGADKQIRFSGLAVDEARSTIQSLVKIFHQGLCHPLPFFPESSKAFAIKALKGDIQSGLEAARKSWYSGFLPGEQENDYFVLCFDRQLPGDELFQQLALSIYTPLLKHQEELKPA